jgi:hypothetical protein
MKSLPGSACEFHPMLWRVFWLALAEEAFGTAVFVSPDNGKAGGQCPAGSDKPKGLRITFSPVFRSSRRNYYV